MTLADESDLTRALAALGQELDSEHEELIQLRARVAEDDAQLANLRQALQNARMIGMAIGIVMEREKLTPDQAFDVLSGLSNRANTKLRDVAERIVLTGEYD